MELPKVGEVVTDGCRVQCHLCGKWFKSVAGHVVRKHGWLSDDYREEFGLNRKQALCSKELSEVFRDNTIRRLSNGTLNPPRYSKENPPSPERKYVTRRLQGNNAKSEALTGRHLSIKERQAMNNNLLHTQDIAPCFYCGRLVVGCKGHNHYCPTHRKIVRASRRREARRKAQSKSSLTP